MCFVEKYFTINPSAICVGIFFAVVNLDHYIATATRVVRQMHNTGRPFTDLINDGVLTVFFVGTVRPSLDGAMLLTLLAMLSLSLSH